jgi:translocation and assembly module TamB
LQIELAATSLVAPPGTFPRARATVEGTLAQHKATLTFAGEDLDIDASAHGGVCESRNAAGVAAWTWAGFLDTLENRGLWSIQLAAPATLEVASDHLHVGEASLRVADGNVELATLTWDDGRIATRGTFAGIPMTTLAKFGGVKLPFVSTVTSRAFIRATARAIRWCGTARKAICPSEAKSPWTTAIARSA